MKEVTFYDMFLLVTILIAFGFKWNAYSSVLVIVASTLELVDVIPKIRKGTQNGR